MPAGSQPHYSCCEVVVKVGLDASSGSSSYIVMVASRAAHVSAVHSLLYQLNSVFLFFISNDNTVDALLGSPFKKELL